MLNKWKPKEGGREGVRGFSLKFKQQRTFYVFTKPPLNTPGGGGGGGWENSRQLCKSEKQFCGIENMLGMLPNCKIWFWNRCSVFRHLVIWSSH